MIPTGSIDINRFYAIGINYKKTDAVIRSCFAVHHAQYNAILTEAEQLSLREVFVLSTCNRTEIYGIASDASQLIGLLCNHTSGDPVFFQSIAYIKQGSEAIQHLFEVGAGLDSQLLGDYEIIGQLKMAFRFAKEKGFTGPFIERLVNAVLQASKEIKNETRLSTGTVSVAFATVQYIRNMISDISQKNVLLIGTGKIGGNTCRNLLDYLPVKKITLINRSVHKAASLAEELKVFYSPIENLPEEISKADIIVVATNAEQPVITKEHLTHCSEKLIIDLSIPYNVEASAGSLPHITLVNVDHLSKVKDETLQARKAEIPKVKSIISLHLQDFNTWNDLRTHVPYLKAIKVQLQNIPSSWYTPAISSTDNTAEQLEKIQKVINGMAIKMRKHRNHGCHFIEAMNEFMTPGVQQ